MLLEHQNLCYEVASSMNEKETMKFEKYGHVNKTFKATKLVDMPKWIEKIVQVPPLH